MKLDCAHAACACLALPDKRYCSEYCRAADESQEIAGRREPSELRATGHVCLCGHTECEERVTSGQAMHEQAR